MVTFPKTQESHPVDKILVASKCLHKGMMFGHLSNGGGIVDLGNGYSLRIVAVNDMYRTFEIYHHGIGKVPETQNYQQKKVVYEKIRVPVKTTKVEEPISEFKVELISEEKPAW